MESEVSSQSTLADRLEIVREGVQANLDRLSATLAEVEASRERWKTAKERRNILHESAYARLLARFESQPVIEQAKGVLMAESHCSPDEAFEMLRRASQRQNTRVRELAAQIVARASSHGRRGAPGHPRGPESNGETPPQARPAPSGRPDRNGGSVSS